ncbi:MAG: hypothetical protein LOD90_02035, partial [Symbiobacteriaceae bacterium]
MAQVIVLDQYEVVRAVLGDGPSACPVVEDLHTERLEGAAISYEFAVPADHPDATTIAPEGYVIIRDLDGNLQQFRIKTVETGLSSQGERVRRVTAENAALELNGEYVRPATWTGVTAAQALANALTGTRWAPGQVEWLGSRTITIDGYKTVTEVLLQIAQSGRKIVSGGIKFVTIPWEPYEKDKNRVQWKQPDAERLFQAIRSDVDLPTPTPSAKSSASHRGSGSTSSSVKTTSSPRAPASRAARPAAPSGSSRTRRKWTSPAFDSIGSATRTRMVRLCTSRRPAMRRSAGRTSNSKAGSYTQLTLPTKRRV